MTVQELSGKIDLTLLKPDALKKDFESLVKEALELEKAYGAAFASICIPPSYVKFTGGLLNGNPLKVSTVIGFPLGYGTIAAKLFEARDAFNNGAAELDIVMNISAFKSGEIKVVEDEIASIVSTLPDAVIKVIIEAAYLKTDEKLLAVNMAVAASAHFVKTSTGFGPGGSTLEDVRLLKEAAGGRIKVKAAGGINSLDTALKMLDAGASRVGTSSGIEIIRELLKRG